jgi:outer membrane protein OmpA-like peptidoglycan-associated protein
VGVNERLTIGHPHDPAERDAARVAQRVLSRPSRAAPRAVRPARGGTGEPLPESERRYFEPRFGHDFSAVRVHRDPTAAAAAAALSARAYAVGDHIVFGAGEYDAADTAAARRLAAHELAHVVQDRDLAVPAATIRRDLVEPRQMTPAGDRVRASPPNGVAIRGGTLQWKLEFVGLAGQVINQGMGSTHVLPKDVKLAATYTPATGPSGAGGGAAAPPACPTVTFIQTVVALSGQMPEMGRLLATRDPASGASVDAWIGDTEPYYGVEPQPTSTPGRRLGWQGSTGQVPGTTAGAGAVATHGDAPVRTEIQRGATITRRFEAAVICIETGETFGSLQWGYTKTSTGVITLLGATPADVSTQAATAGFEAVRQAFYQGQFQLSLSDFARGSPALTAQHRQTLRAMPTANLTRVVLVGANDGSGGPEANAQLSLRRAQAARDFVVNQLRVPASIVEVEGHGVEARQPNPPGQAVAANRRVDVHFEQSTVQFQPQGARAGSRAERARLRRQDPRATVDEVVDWIMLLDNSTGRVSGPDIDQLDWMLQALDTWRLTDATIPNPRTIYRDAIRRIRARNMAPIERQRPELGPAPLEPPSFIPRIRSDTGGL